MAKKRSKAQQERDQKFMEGGKDSQFSAANQPAGRGRKKSVLKQLSIEVNREFSFELSFKDKCIIMEHMLELTMPELQSIAANPKSPAFMVMVAHSIRRDVANGTLVTLDQIFNRLYGRPAQTNILYSAGADDERKKEIRWKITEIIESDDDIEDAQIEEENAAANDKTD